LPSWSRPERPVSSVSASAIFCGVASPSATWSCWDSAASPTSAAAISARASASYDVGP